MSETFLTYSLYVFALLIPLGLYLFSLRRQNAKANESAQKGELHSEGPRAQHPQIDTTHCIGCQSCTMVCPEGDVLAMLGGKAAIVNGHKCIGHGLCADACPVGAIQLVMASPSMSAELPFLTEEYETSISNLFIIGELGGLALIKNAVNQGRECVDTIVNRRDTSRRSAVPGVQDVIIVGAGPAGISASLRAIERKLSYLTIERENIGGTVAKYPRQKLVMTSPVEFPMYGKFKKLELSKENLLSFWNTILDRADFEPRTHENVEDIRKGDDGIFVVQTQKGEYRAHAVILALGRTGIPRKLDVPGEDLPKVMYRLIEADHYINKKILVVGGGDSAIEAAIGLAQQKSNTVTLSYRKDAFSRIKERNAKHIADYMRSGKIRVIFNSMPIEIRAADVVLNLAGSQMAIPIDYVWVFAGGTPPNDFLKRIGVAFGSRDLTLESKQELQTRNAM